MQLNRERSQKKKARHGGLSTLNLTLSYNEKDKERRGAQDHVVLSCQANANPWGCCPHDMNSDEVKSDMICSIIIQLPKSPINMSCHSIQPLQKIVLLSYLKYENFGKQEFYLQVEILWGQRKTTTITPSSSNALLKHAEEHKNCLPVSCTYIHLLFNFKAESLWSMEVG